jgi:hypothetical protein
MVGYHLILGVLLMVIAIGLYLFDGKWGFPAFLALVNFQFETLNMLGF